MSIMIQIRNVPAPLHRTLKVRATEAGMSLSDYLLREMEQVARRPTIHELLARIQARGQPRGRIDSVALIRADRESRR